VLGLARRDAGRGRVERAVHPHRAGAVEAAQGARVLGRHREHEVARGEVARAHLAGTVRPVDDVPVLGEDAARAAVDRVPPLLVADPRRVDDHAVAETGRLEAVAQDHLGHGGPADVAGADGHDAVGRGGLGTGHGPILREARAVLTCGRSPGDPRPPRLP